MEIQLKWNQKKVDELASRLEKILFLRQESGVLHNTPLWNEAEREDELLEVGAAYCLTLCRYIHKRNSRYHPLVRQAKEYVFKHFHEKIIIDDMAKQLGTSSTYLGRIFRASENMTLHQFIMNEKMERGKNLLRYSDYDLQAISQYLGFASQSHFGKEFKRYTGETPADFRMKKNQNYRKNM